MNFLNQLRMRTRLLGAFAIATAITLVIGVLGVNATSRQADTTASLYDNQLLPVRELANANMQALYISRNLNTYVITNDPAEITRLKGRIEERLKNYKELMAKYRATQLAPKEIELLGKLDAAWPIYLAAEAKVFQLADEGKDALRKLITTGDIFIHIETLRRSGIEDLQPGDDVMVRFAEGPKGLVVAEIESVGLS